MMAAVAIFVRAWFSESKANELNAAVDRKTNPETAVSDTIWNATTMTLGLASICSGIAVFGFSGLYPTYLRGALGFTPQQAAQVMSAIGIGGFLAPLGGWLGDRWGNRNILLVALPLAAITGGISFTELGRSVMAHALIAGVFGAAVVGLLYTNMSAIIINSVTAANVAKTSGVFIASYYVPAAFAGYMLAQLKEATDWTTAGVLQTSGFALVAMILIVVAGTTRRPVMMPVRT
jgi:DHA1 family inner membrane transport protein